MKRPPTWCSTKGLIKQRRVSYPPLTKCSRPSSTSGGDAMRVNPNPMPNLLAALVRVQLDEQTAMLEITTGRRVNKPSDDPTAAAVLVQNQDRSDETAQFLKSLSNMRGQLQTADATLNSMVLAIQRAITIGVEGASGTLSSANRASLAGELSGIQDQLLSLANVSFQGQYL